MKKNKRENKALQFFDSLALITTVVTVLFLSALIGALTFWGIMILNPVKSVEVITAGVMFAGIVACVFYTLHLELLSKNMKKKLDKL